MLGWQDIIGESMTAVMLMMGGKGFGPIESGRTQFFYKRTLGYAKVIRGGAPLIMKITTFSPL